MTLTQVSMPWMMDRVQRLSYSGLTQLNTEWSEYAKKGNFFIQFTIYIHQAQTIYCWPEQNEISSQLLVFHQMLNVLLINWKSYYT